MSTPIAIVVCLAAFTLLIAFPLSLLVGKAIHVGDRAAPLMPSERTGFVQEGDGQQILDGDYAPFPIDGTIHFVQFSLMPCSPASGQIATQLLPAEETLCGLEMPNWRDDPTSYPIAGRVNCDECLRRAVQRLERMGDV